MITHDEIEVAFNKIGNKFECILLASKRARDLIIKKTQPKLQKPTTDKTTVIALKEISQGLINKDYLDNKIKNKKKKHVLFRNQNRINLAIEDLKYRLKNKLEITKCKYLSIFE